MTEAFEWREAPPGDFAVIGDPVSHSLSPRMHMAAFAQLGLPYRYLAIHVREAEVSEALDHLRALGYRGANVTVPNKREAYLWTCEADEFSTHIKAVNTLDIQGCRGTNTDGPGLLDTLHDLRLGEGSSALVLGAGGAARAAALALSTAGYRVAVYNRTKERAVQMVKELSVQADVVDVALAESDVVINATAAGLTGEAPEVVWSGTPAIAYDMLYGAGPTPFLKQAMENGWKTVDGRALLVAQGVRSFEWWLGVPAPKEAMAEAVA
jgi:shikimate dehydrogenase